MTTGKLGLHVEAVAIAFCARSVLGDVVAEDTVVRISSAQSIISFLDHIFLGSE